MCQEKLPSNYQNVTETLNEMQTYFERAFSEEISKKIQLIILYHRDVGNAYIRLSEYIKQVHRTIEDFKELPNQLVASEDTAFLKKYRQLYDADIEPTVVYLAAQLDGVTEPMLTKLLKMTYQLTDETIENIRSSLNKHGATDDSKTK